MRLPIIAALVATLVLTACGGARNPSGNDIFVTGAGPTATVVGGANAQFTMTASNIGNDAATDVKIVNSVGNQLALVSITCTATGGTVCPDTPGVSMSIPNMDPGSSLTFVVTATVANTANGTITNTMTATVANDADRTNNSATVQAAAQSLTTFGVTQSAPATVAAGTSLTFVAVVSNPGPGVADNISVAQTLTPNYPVTVTCTAFQGAVCPTTLSQNITGASLPAGRSFAISYQITVPSTARGNIVSTVTVNSDGDTQTDNNTASTTSVADSPMSGTYQAYASNGNIYSLTIDFDALTYTMSSATTTGTPTSFTADATGGGYTVSGNARLRTADNLIVGGHDFGAGVIPYVAARAFITTLPGGTYNLATRNVYGTGPTTHAGTARISGNTLQICQQDDLVTTAQNCGSALKNYPLTLNVDEFTGVETTAGDVFTFRLARSGDATILLSAITAADTSLQFRIGLPDSAGLIGGSLSGSSTNGDWISVLMTPSSYQYVGATLSELLQLQLADAQGPFAMLPDIAASPVIVTDPGTQLPTLPFITEHYVLQASPLAVMVGTFGGTANGLLQISLP